MKFGPQHLWIDVKSHLCRFQAAMFLHLTLYIFILCQASISARKDPTDKSFKRVLKRSEEGTVKELVRPSIDNVAVFSRTINISWTSDPYTYNSELLYGITHSGLKVVKLPGSVKNYELMMLEPGTTYKVTLRVFYEGNTGDSVSKYITTKPRIPEEDVNKIVEVTLKILHVRPSLTKGLFGAELLKRYIHRELRHFVEQDLRLGVFDVFAVRKSTTMTWVASLHLKVDRSMNIERVFLTLLRATEGGKVANFEVTVEEFSFKVYRECCLPLLHESFDDSDQSKLHPLRVTILQRSMVEGRCKRGLNFLNTDLFLNGKISNRFEDVTIAAFVKVVDGYSLHPIFSSVDSSGQVRLEILGGKVVWMMYDLINSQGYVVSTKRQIEPNRWYHVLASYSEITGIAEVYVDGALQAKDTSSLKLELGWWASPRLGKYYSGAYVYRLNGMLDEIFIFPCLLPKKTIFLMAEGCYDNQCAGARGAVDGPSSLKGIRNKQGRNCFCASRGLSQDCEEVFWYPSKVEASSVNSQGFIGTSLVSIADGGKFHKPEQNVIVTQEAKGLVAFLPLSSQKIWYWKIPPAFLGNKLTSYGKSMKYSISYTGWESLLGKGSVQRSNPDIVIEGSEGTFLQLFGVLAPKGNEEVEVIIEEGTWLNRARQTASKSEVMGVLIDILNIYIRADYGRNTKEIRLLSVALGMREEKRSESSQVSESFMKCRCQHGKTGIACELSNTHSKQCSTDGSVSQEFNPIPATENCLCKGNVVGERCDQCKNGTFNLDGENALGCTPCFCNGVADRCQSASLTKSQISINAQDINNLGLGTVDKSLSVQSKLVYNPLTNSVTFKAFDDKYPSTADFFYWELPLRYCGDKLQSYGGILRYTVSYVSKPADRPVKGPDVILTGNGITLHYTENGEPPAVTKYYYNVFLDEKFWKLPYGGPVKREEMIMALAKIDSILLRASFSTEMVATSLYEVTLDIATYDPLTSSRTAAPMVEECQCPGAYFGLSCQYCNKGYRKRAGKYLGRCVPCQCNGHSDDCDGETGHCKNCQHNTNGTHCSSCKQGYYGDPTTGRADACKPCPCPLTVASNQFSSSCVLDKDGQPTCTNCPKGYFGRRCESCRFPYVGNPSQRGEKCKLVEQNSCDHCSEDGTIANGCNSATGKCSCKEYVTGNKCDRCKNGYFFLEAANKRGCMKCFCSSITDVCSSAGFYTHRLILRSNEPPPSVANIDGLVLKNKIVYSGRSNSEFVVSGVNSGDGTLFWSLPKIFLRSRVTSYRGILSYTISYDTTTSQGFHFQEKDVIMKGMNVLLHHKHGRTIKARQVVSVKVPLKEGFWFRENGHLATRNDILLVLMNVEYILIRASYHILASHTAISNIILESAVNYDTRLGRAPWVEICQCPQGYSGLSCEQCAPGYTRTIDTRGKYSCQRCHCNRHSLECDPESGICKGCQHHTLGNHCEQCSHGYYGDATGGTAEDCKRCKCPLEIASNQFSPSCKLMTDNKPTCDACAVGFQGRDCGECAPGYTGNPRIPGNKCGKSVYQGDMVPQVSISPSRRVDKRGYKATFECSVKGKQPMWISWSRKDSQPLPSRSQVTTRGLDSTLEISDLRPVDGESYICTARNDLGIASKSAYLVVIDLKIDPIRVSVSPKSLNIHVGSTAIFRCQARSRVTETLRWIRDGYDQLPPGATVKGGILTLPNVQRLWSGLYTCIGSNQVSVDRASVQLRVGVSIKPQISVIPSQLTVDVGQTAVFRCTATGFPYPQVTWSSPTGVPFPANIDVRRGNLFISNSQDRNEGTYFCNAQNSGGAVRKAVALYVRGPGKMPTVIIATPLSRVRQGLPFRINCKVSGSPRPFVEWTHSVSGLVTRGLTRGGLLHIPHVRQSDEGDYVCIARNVYGTARGQARLIVSAVGTQKPTVSLRPQSQVVTPGSYVSLHCRTSGDPEPLIVWKRENGMLTRRHLINRNTLVIAEANFQDTGKYTCSARNSLGSAIGSAVLLVQESKSPMLKIHPSINHTAYAGEEVELLCIVVAGMPSPSVHWEMPNGTSTGECNKDMKCSLKFEVALTDTGIFSCVANNTAGSTRAAMRLTVLGLPRLKMSPSYSIAAVVGDLVTISCQVFGDPLPDVSLRHEHGEAVKVMEKQTRPGYVSLSFAADLASGGRFLCTGQNREGRAEANTTLTVYKHGRKPEVMVNKKVLNISSGTKGEFTCVGSGIPTPTLSWFKVLEGGRTSLLLQRRGVVLELLFPQANPMNEGMYICSADNRLGSSDISVSLQVSGGLELPKSVLMSEASISVVRGHPLNLLCRGEGFPKPQVRWYREMKKSNPLAVSYGGLFEISSALLNDSGLYVCETENDVGQHRAAVNVTVIDPARITGEKEDSVIASLGGPYAIFCNATGIPPPQFQWLYNGVILHNDTSPKLSFSKLSAEDQGQYKCRASNQGGSGEYTVNLRIRELPSVHISGGISVRAVPVGHSFKTRCTGAGKPEPVITWSRVSQKTLPDVNFNHGILHIPSVLPRHAGTYRCTVSNERGSVRSEISLVVQVAPLVRVHPKKAEARIHQSIRFHCRASGLPKPRIQWYKINGEMPPDHINNSTDLIINKVSTEHIGTYACRATSSAGRTEDYVTVKVRDFLPRFSSRDGSYITLPKIQRALYKTDFEISFKPQHLEGTLIYSGQVGKDFISLGIKNGYVLFQYDLGSGPALIQSAMRVTINKWHTVAASRDGLDGVLKLDDQPIIYGKAQGQYTGLNLQGDVFIGGHSSSRHFSTVPNEGFSGCISRLAVSGRVIKLDPIRFIDLEKRKPLNETLPVIPSVTDSTLKRTNSCPSQSYNTNIYGQEAISMHNVTDCDSCESEPCLNGGVCEETAEITGFRCHCLLGYAGETCERRVERCFPDACGLNGKCMNIPEGGFTCRCPIGLFGDRCSKGQMIATPFFNRTSYLEVPAEENVWQRLSLLMTFKPYKKDGTLLFCGPVSSAGNKKGFLSIALVNGQVELRFSSGSGTAVIHNYDRVSMNTWNTLYVDRFMQYGSLQLNGNPAYKGKAQGVTMGLNLAPNFYIGGLPNATKIEDRVGLSAGFVGCVQEVTLNGKRLNIISDFKTSKNIKGCHAQSSPCDSTPCKNNGECEVMSALSFKCNCHQRFTGRQCETLIRRCGQIEECLNKGVCSKNTPRKCSCPLGFAGKACEYAVKTDESMFFQGDGFIEYPRNISRSPELRTLEFGIKTKQSDGLVFWHSETKAKPESNPDFLFIGLKDGKVIVSYELGSGLAVLESSKFVNDGRWRLVNFTRTNRKAVLTIDGTWSVVGQSSGLNKNLDIAAPFFLGGGPDLETLTSNRFQNGLVGCLSNLVIGERPILLQTMALRGSGVNPCTDRVIKELTQSFL